MAPKVTSSTAPASTRNAGKRKAPAVEKVSPAVSSTKKPKGPPPATRPSPKGILKKAPILETPSTSANKKAKSPPSPTVSASRKGKGKATTFAKSPLTANKPLDHLAVTPDEDQDGESIASADEAQMLKGLSSDDDDDAAAAAADSSDEEESQEGDDDSSDEDDSSALKRHSSILTSSLPSSKDDAAVKQRLDRLAKQRKSQPTSQNVNTAVLYVGHLPKHFTEQPLRQYFSQFGTISRLRLSRNKKSGASKHYGFIEFADEEVGRIVQETMDNYLILGQLLRVKILNKDEIHPKLWIGANRTFRKVPGDRIARVQHDGPKTAEQRAKVEAGLVSRQDKKRKALKEAGIDYDFDGYTNGPIGSIA